MRYASTKTGIARVREDGHLDLLDLPHEDLGLLLRSGASAELPDARVLRTVEPSDVELTAPVPRPGKVVFIGLNYPSHAEEFAADPDHGGHPVVTPRRPNFFVAPSSAVIGSGTDIRRPDRYPDQVDYEGELAVIISKTATAVDAGEAEHCIAGFTAANDVTARDLQLKALAGARGIDIAVTKSFDTFKPLGPYLATVDELGPNPDLALKTYVNDDLRQDDRTGHTYFSVPELISYVSSFQSLHPGDVLLTGAPAGSGMFSGRRFLKSGDDVTVDIEGIGRLENRVT